MVKALSRCESRWATLPGNTKDVLVTLSRCTNKCRGTCFCCPTTCTTVVCSNSWAVAGISCRTEEARWCTQICPFLQRIVRASTKRSMVDGRNLRMDGGRQGIRSRVGKDTAMRGHPLHGGVPCCILNTTAKYGNDLRTTLNRIGRSDTLLSKGCGVVEDVCHLLWPCTRHA